MKQKTKKTLFYVYLVLSILVILSLLFSTIYFYRNIQEPKTRYGNCISDCPDLNKKYEDCMSNKICVCVCPIPPDPNEICRGPITWCGPDKIGQWEIINGKCQWICS